MDKPEEAAFSEILDVSCPKENRCQTVPQFLKRLIIHGLETMEQREKGLDIQLASTPTEKLTF